MAVISPINESENITKIEELDANKIIDLYKSLGIDVRRFFENLKKISLYQCNESLYRFYHPLSIFGDDQFYQELYSTIPNYYHPQRWEYGYAITQIRPGSTVLEIGSGAGIFLERLRQSNCEVTGLELNSKAIADSREKGLTVHAEFVETFAQKHVNQFDVVCSFQVLEHVANVKSFIEAALLALKPGGKLILSVPNSHPYFLKHDKYHTLNLPPHHSGLWNRSSLEKLAAFFPMNLEAIKIEPLKEYKEWYLIQVNHYKEKKPLLAALMKIVPRFVYKRVLSLLSSNIEGSYITAVYQKK